VRLRLVERVRWFAALPGGVGLREVPGGCIRGIRQVCGACYAGCVPGHAARAGGSGWVVLARSFLAEGSPAAGGASACGFWELYGPVRGCPWDRRRGWPGARTYSGQRRGRGRHARSFPQVRGHVEVQAGAVCKTVGSAYVGSNPTPATHLRRSEPVTLECVTGFRRKGSGYTDRRLCPVGYAWAGSGHRPASADIASDAI